MATHHNMRTLFLYLLSRKDEVYVIAAESEGEARTLAADMTEPARDGNIWRAPDTSCRKLGVVTADVTLPAGNLRQTILHVIY